MLLAIETSCDETAVALIDPACPLDACAGAAEFLRADLVSSQVELHKPYGGVVPELAAREHLRNLPILVNAICEQEGIRIRDLSAVAVTCGPGLKGCLLVGVTFGSGLAYARSIPFLSINHLEGHLYSGDLMPIQDRPPEPSLVLLVSGGHTELVLVEGFRRYRIIARTRDDAVGEAFDKCATLLGLPYPGGPALSMLAADGDRSRFALPIGMSADASAFSFSGVKTAVQRLLRDPGHGDISDPQLRADIAASIEQALVDALVRKTEMALEKYRPAGLMICGGVAANRLLRERTEALAKTRGVKYSSAPLRWCGDNAAMIGAVARRRWHDGAGVAGAGSRFVREPVLARARWPLEELCDLPRNG